MAVCLTVFLESGERGGRREKGKDQTKRERKEDEGIRQGRAGGRVAQETHWAAGREHLSTSRSLGGRWLISISLYMVKTGEEYRGESFCLLMCRLSCSRSQRFLPCRWSLSRFPLLTRHLHHKTDDVVIRRELFFVAGEKLMRG